MCFSFWDMGFSDGLRYGEGRLKGLVKTSCCSVGRASLPAV
ncbi:hypothetical protein [Neisseria dumasiana]|nr:hypothetical protein [Neisseria dumasiana]